MKISFDFDGCLSEDYIQLLAKSLIQSGNDVWVITAREIFFNKFDKETYLKIFNRDVLSVCKDIGIDSSKVIITGGSLKFDYYISCKFDLHFDDDWREVLEINNRGGHAVLVNPDYQKIYMEMQYKNNQNNIQND
jgi:hypothetical protein